MRREIYVLLRALLASGALLALWGCGPDDAPEPDPCAEVGEFKADFKLRFYHGTNYTPVILELENGDSIIYGPILQVDMDGSYDTVKWFLNGERHYRYTEKHAFFHLDKGVGGIRPGEWMKITLIATPANPECYGTPQKDTLTKVVFVREENFTDSVAQTYLGANNYYLEGAPQDTFAMTVHYGMLPRSNIIGYYVTGFPEFCEEHLVLDFVEDFAAIRDDGSSCRGGGLLYYNVAPNDIIFVSEKLGDENNQRDKDTLYYHLIRN